jgi:hypothetical protein
LVVDVTLCPQILQSLQKVPQLVGQQVQGFKPTISKSFHVNSLSGISVNLIIVKDFPNLLILKLISEMVCSESELKPKRPEETESDFIFTLDPISCSYFHSPEGLVVAINLLVFIY